MKKILVVEDEQSIATLLQYNLEQAGYTVYIARDGNTAIAMTLSEEPDLLLLDIMLPGMDGMDVCKKLRQEKIHTPILMLTAKGDEFDKVLGLELGADDYLTKPFSPREVLARVKAILRRIELQNSAQVKELGTELSNGRLLVYPDRIEAFLDGSPLELTPKEFELLLYLMRHSGKVLHREQLLNAIWNYDYTGDSRIVDVHISHLREKIEPDTKSPVYIKTVRGFGYKFEEVTN
ncbi:DNA-binding response regulator [Sporosarcina sp. P21c]|uniref:response regulator transcription factor n=1 Tax=Sporosarcina TaxID=1569 RepID=UPI000A15FD72|nr:MULTISPECIES: response regulator transcription factor [Sporosarcina]ARJ37967.1 DNA-binding response regulator [Sporosarcina ureae]PIC67720.1 DNA-binding response regulator [Sporosarcina sp. P16a]PIC83713.1 DNA-binding response regulator [Sporosarcina sp. P1]PIC90579.1 DNA-binding response regulator [Sporosarcina sp. P21c]PIC93345.1 DNA-binding response regulator [Sporosarcina sp. P25]